jgi:hypothetical protein
VCTTVIGAGFPTKVTSRLLPEWIAHVRGDLLAFEEERQFLAVDLVPGADRQSYLFIQKGWADHRSMVWCTRRASRFRTWGRSGGWHRPSKIPVWGDPPAFVMVNETYDSGAPGRSVKERAQRRHTRPGERH